MKRFHPSSDWRALEACCRPWTWWCNDATALAGYVKLMMMMMMMLCIRGTSHGPVSVCLSVSVCHKSEFY